MYACVVALSWDFLSLNTHYMYDTSISFRSLQCLPPPCPAPLKLDSTKLKSARKGDKSEVTKTLKVSSRTIGKSAGRTPSYTTEKVCDRRSRRTPQKILGQKPAFITKGSAPQPTGQPTRWFFYIHVDTTDEEASNTMLHFIGRLNISGDDEAKVNIDDESNKENISLHRLRIV